MFIVTVPKQNLKQSSGRKGSVSIQAAFKSRCLSYPPTPPPPWLSETCKPRRFIAALPHAGLELRVQISEIPAVLRRERDKGRP